jgi:putative membrane protein
MTYAALLFAGIAALLHVYIWTMESITWKQPATWKRFGLESQADADTTAPMAYNQGYYNLFLAVITIIGMALIVVVDWDDAGWALLIAACGSMAAASLVLLSTGAGYARAAATQGTVPALAVICAVLGIA